MAATLVQSSGARSGNGTSQSWTWATAPTVGNVIIVKAVGWASPTGPTASCADAASNSYTQRTNELSTGSGATTTRAAIFDCVIASSPSSTTVTWSVSSDHSVVFEEWSGLDTASLSDQVATPALSGLISGSGSRTLTVGPTGTLAQANELVQTLLGAATGLAASNIATPSGYTGGVFEQNSPSFIGMGSAYTTVAATTAVDATWPFDVAGDAGQTAVALLATYRIASPPPPTITGQPTDQTVNNGATATFSVTATGTAPITYQWQDNSSGSFADISGATSSSYSPTASYSIQGRQYRCIVTDANGTATSAAATLRVAFSLSGTGPRSVSLLGHPFGAGAFEAWVRGTASAGGGAAALDAAVACSTTVLPALTTQIRLSGSASIQSTVAAALTTSIRLSAAVADQVTAAAALSTQIRLAATPAGQVTVSASLTTGIQLAAAAQSVVTINAALAGNGAALQAAAQAQATVASALTTGIPLAAQASVQATLSAALSTGIRLAAAPQAACTVGAALTTGVRLAATVQGVTTLSAALAGTAAPLQASALAQATVAADLGTQIGLQAAVADVATVGAALSTGIQLVAAASSSCTIAATLTTAIRLQSSVQAVVTASATLAGTAAALQASVQSQATVAAALTVAKPLACFVIAQAQVSAALTTRIALQAIAQAQATATAALTTQQSYEAAVLCSVTVAAAFQVYPGARASAPGVQLARSGGQSLRRPAVVALKRK